MLGFIKYYNITVQNKNLKFKTNINKVYIKMISENSPENEKTIAIGKKIISSEIIKQREIKLKNLAEKWKFERLEKEALKNKNFGFTKNSEILNGRMAMFFLLTGILTEIWASQTIPEQIETMVRIFGII